MVTDTQLYQTIGVPTLAIVLAYTAIVAQLAAINTRIGDIVSQLDRFGDKFESFLRH
jgi:hypothetical protein